MTLYRKMSAREVAELIDALKELRKAAGIGSFGVLVEELRTAALFAAFTFLLLTLILQYVVRAQDAREARKKAAAHARAAIDAQRRRMIARRIDRQRAVSLNQRSR